MTLKLLVFFFKKSQDETELKNKLSERWKNKTKQKNEKYNHPVVYLQFPYHCCPVSKVKDGQLRLIQWKKYSHSLPILCHPKSINLKINLKILSVYTKD
jgi:hypothetical protein